MPCIFCDKPRVFFDIRKQLFFMKLYDATQRFKKSAFPLKMLTQAFIHDTGCRKLLPLHTYSIIFQSIT